MSSLVRLAARKIPHLLAVRKTLRPLAEQKTPHLLAELRISNPKGVPSAEKRGGHILI